MPFNERVGVYFAGLENTLRGDIRINNHMKVGGSDWRAANHHPFCAPSSTMAYSPPVLIPAQLERVFDHRFANMNLKTRFDFAIANVAVGTPAAVTRQVRSVSGECQQVGHSLDSGKRVFVIVSFFHE